MYRKVFKRWLDLFVALIAFVILLPIALIVAFLLFIGNGGNPLFFQRRPGRNSKIFNIIKFKTMNDKKDEFGNLLHDEQRLTWIGAFVRKTSLDEIPQLLNVISGDMSLVGPRPLLPSYIELYNDFQMRRHEVKPGMTGWAQVNGRNSISWDQKFAFDIWYVDNYSFLLDFKILVLTFFKVIKSEAVSPNDAITMEAFKGNKK